MGDDRTKLEESFKDDAIHLFLGDLSAQVSVPEALDLLLSSLRARNNLKLLTIDVNNDPLLLKQLISHFNANRDAWMQVIDGNPQLIFFSIMRVNKSQLKSKYAEYTTKYSPWDPALYSSKVEKASGSYSDVEYLDTDTAVLQAKPSVFKAEHLKIIQSHLKADEKPVAINLCENLSFLQNINQNVSEYYSSIFKGRYKIIRQRFEELGLNCFKDPTWSDQLIFIEYIRRRNHGMRKLVQSNPDALIQAKKAQTAVVKLLLQYWNSNYFKTMYVTYRTFAEFVEKIDSNIAGREANVGIDEAPVEFWSELLETAEKEYPGLIQKLQPERTQFGKAIVSAVIELAQHQRPCALKRLEWTFNEVKDGLDNDEYWKLLQRLATTPNIHLELKLLSFPESPNSIKRLEALNELLKKHQPDLFIQFEFGLQVSNKIWSKEFQDTLRKTEGICTANRRLHQYGLYVDVPQTAPLAEQKVSRKLAVKERVDLPNADEPINHNQIISLNNLSIEQQVVAQQRQVQQRHQQTVVQQHQQIQARLQRQQQQEQQKTKTADGSRLMTRDKAVIAARKLTSYSKFGQQMIQQMNMLSDEKILEIWDKVASDYSARGLRQHPDVIKYLTESAWESVLAHYSEWSCGLDITQLPQGYYIQQYEGQLVLSFDREFGRIALPNQHGIPMQLDWNLQTAPLTKDHSDGAIVDLIDTIVAFEVDLGHSRVNELYGKDIYTGVENLVFRYGHLLTHLSPNDYNSLLTHCRKYGLDGFARVMQECEWRGFYLETTYNAANYQHATVPDRAFYNVETESGGLYLSEINSPAWMFSKTHQSGQPRKTVREIGPKNLDMFHAKSQILAQQLSSKLLANTGNKEQFTKLPETHQAFIQGFSNRELASLNMLDCEGGRVLTQPFLTSLMVFQQADLELFLSFRETILTRNFNWTCFKDHQRFSKNLVRLQTTLSGKNGEQKKALWMYLCQEHAKKTHSMDFDKLLSSWELFLKHLDEIDSDLIWPKEFSFKDAGNAFVSLNVIEELLRNAVNPSLQFEDLNGLSLDQGEAILASRKCNFYHCCQEMQLHPVIGTQDRPNFFNVPVDEWRRHAFDPDISFEWFEALTFRYLARVEVHAGWQNYREAIAKIKSKPGLSDREKKNLLTLLVISTLGTRNAQRFDMSQWNLFITTKDVSSDLFLKAIIRFSPYPSLNELIILKDSLFLVDHRLSDTLASVLSQKGNWLWDNLQGLANGNYFEKKASVKPEPEVLSLIDRFCQEISLADPNDKKQIKKHIIDAINEKRVTPEQALLIAKYLSECVFMGPMIQRLVNPEPWQLDSPFLQTLSIIVSLRLIEKNVAMTSSLISDLKIQIDGNSDLNTAEQEECKRLVDYFKLGVDQPKIICAIPPTLQKLKAQGVQIDKLLTTLNQSIGGGKNSLNQACILLNVFMKMPLQESQRILLCQSRLPTEIEHSAYLINRLNAQFQGADPERIVRLVLQVEDKAAVILDWLRQLPENQKREGELILDALLKKEDKDKLTAFSDILSKSPGIDNQVVLAVLKNHSEQLPILSKSNNSSLLMAILANEAQPIDSELLDSLIKLLGPVDIAPATPTFCGLSAESMDPADKPRDVGPEMKCQQTLDAKKELHQNLLAIVQTHLVPSIEAIIRYLKDKSPEAFVALQTNPHRKPRDIEAQKKRKKTLRTLAQLDDLLPNRTIDMNTKFSLLNHFNGVQKHVDRYAQQSNSELQSELNRVKELKDLESKYQLLAILREMAYRSTANAKGEGLFASSTQMLAVIDAFFHEGNLTVQFNTGEGKTLVLALYNAARALKTNQAIDMLTSNDTLAQRDMGLFARFYSAAGITISHIAAKSHFGEYLQNESAINFASYGDMAQFMARARYDGHLEKTGNELSADEFDDAVYDKRTQFNLAMNISGDAGYQDSEFNPHGWLYAELNDFIDSDEYKKSKTKGDAVRNAKAFLSKKHPFVSSWENRMDIDLNRLIEAGVSAKGLKEGIHYQILPEVRIRGGKDVPVRFARIIVDGFTDYEAQWGKGVQQMLHARLNKKDPEGPEFVLDAEQAIVLSMSSKNLIDCYCDKRIVGFTATPGSAMEMLEANRKYSMSFHRIPPHHRSQVVDLPLEIVENHDAVVHHCIQDILSAVKKGQPLVLVCETPKDVNELYKALSAHSDLKKLPKDTIQLLTGDKPDQLKGVIDKAGVPGKITIATAMISRGVDITLQKGNESKGIKIKQLYYSRERVNIQVRGRGGRQGLYAEYGSLLNLEKYTALKQADNPYLYTNQALLTELWGKVEYDDAVRRQYDESIADIRDLLNTLYCQFKKDNSALDSRFAWHNLQNDFERECQKLHTVPLDKFQSELEKLIDWSDDQWQFFSQKSAKIDFYQHYYAYLQTMDCRWYGLKKEEINDAPKLVFNDSKTRKEAFHEAVTQWNNYLKTKAKEQNQVMQSKIPKAYQSQPKAFKKAAADMNECYRRTEYDPNLDGHAKVYSTLFADTRAMLTGKRPLFANTRAWLAGRGTLFADTRAMFQRGLFSNTRQSLLRMKQQSMLKKIKEVLNKVTEVDLSENHLKLATLYDKLYAMGKNAHGLEWSSLNKIDSEINRITSAINPSMKQR